MKDPGNGHETSNKRINELGSGSQSLLQKLISLEKDIGERCGNLDKTDEQLLSMINKLGNDTEAQFGSFKTDIDSQFSNLDKKDIDMVKFVKSEHAPIRQCFESIRSTHASILIKISDMDNGTQQLLEKLVNLESDLDQKYSGMTDSSADLQSRVDKSDIEVMNNSQSLVSIQDIATIQSEQVKKVASERQKSSDESNKALQANADAHTKAIEEMGKALRGSISERHQNDSCVFHSHLSAIETKGQDQD